MPIDIKILEDLQTIMIINRKIVLISETVRAGKNVQTDFTATIHIVLLKSFTTLKNLRLLNAERSLEEVGNMDAIEEISVHSIIMLMKKLRLNMKQWNFMIH